MEFPEGVERVPQDYVSGHFIQSRSSARELPHTDRAERQGRQELQIDFVATQQRNLAIQIADRRDDAHGGAAGARNAHSRWRRVESTLCIDQGDTEVPQDSQQPGRAQNVRVIVDQQTARACIHVDALDTIRRRQALLSSLDQLSMLLRTVHAQT